MAKMNIEKAKPIEVPEGENLESIVNRLIEHRKVGENVYCEYKTNHGTFKFFSANITVQSAKKMIEHQANKFYMELSAYIHILPVPEGAYNSFRSIVPEDKPEEQLRKLHFIADGIGKTDEAQKERLLDRKDTFERLHHNHSMINFTYTFADSARMKKECYARIAAATALGHTEFTRQLLQKVLFTILEYTNAKMNPSDKPHKASNSYNLVPEKPDQTS